MLTTYPDIYAAQRHRVQAVEPPSWDIIAPPFTAYKQEMASRRSTVEGVFASQDRLGWERCKLRGLWKVDCEGYISALAHNFSKAVRKLGGMGPPGPAVISERAAMASG